MKKKKPMKLFFEITKITNYVLVGLLIFLVLLYLVLPSPKDLPCFIMVHGTGESMLPTLKNDTFLLVDVCKAQYRVGDIVVFETKSNVYVSHRIIAINEAKMVFATKGDNNKEIDGIFTADKLIGKIMGEYDTDKIIYLKW